MRATKLEIEGADFAWLDRTLQGVEFFTGLNIGQLEKVLEAFSLYLYPKGSVIFKQGDAGDAMFVVFQGAVEVTKKKGTFSFKEKITRLGAGQLFGEMALVEAAPRVATITAVEDTKLFVLLKDDFNYVVEKNPEVGQHIQRLIARRKFELGQK